MRFIPALLASTLGLSPSLAHAYDFSSLYFFGDSLTDEGRAGRTAPVMWPSVLRNDTTITQGQNLAIGGATTSNQPSAVFGDSSYLGQVNAFVSAATPIAPNAAAGIWIGTNNIQIGSAQHQSATTIAQGASADVQTGIKQLVGAGIHNVLLLGTYDLSLTNAYQLAGVNTLAVRLTAASASQQYNTQLASLAVPGATIQYFNIANFINYLQSNPRLFGFQQILPLQAGAACNATCQQTSIFDDTIHLSAKTQTLIGNYIASGDPVVNSAPVTYGAIVENIASANIAAPILLDSAVAENQAFVGALFDRLEASRFMRPRNAIEGEGRSSTTAVTPWSVFAYGGVDGGRLPGVGSPSGYQSDLDYTVSGMTAGIQYAFSPELRVGSAFNYDHTTSDLTQSIGVKTRIDSYQGAFYASLTHANWFLDGIVTAGFDGFGQTRSGIFGRLNSAPDGYSVSVSERAGYLFPLGLVKVGPVSGLSYTRSGIDSFQETGNSLYTVGYDAQHLNSLRGNAGLELRMATRLTWPFDPFVTVTYEREFLDYPVFLSSYLANLPTQSLPLSVLTTQYSAVKVVLGTNIDFGQGWGGSLTAIGLKGEQSIYTLGINGGVSYRF